MNPIVTKELKDVRYALGSYDTAKNRYNQIKRTFPEGNEYRIFAEPIILSEGMKISWVTEYEGSIINFSRLNPEEQSRTKDKLSEQMRKLFEAAKKFDDVTLVDFLYKCIEIPNLNDIYLVRKNNEDFVVLTQWGFLSDVPGADKGLLEKIINAQRVPMIFDVVYMDGTTPAPGEEIHFEYEGKKEIFKSDSSGRIIIDKVKVDAYVKAYQVENETAINLHTFTCYENGKFVIKVLQKIDMLFRVITSRNTPLPGEEYILKFNDQEVKMLTDAKGEMILPKIRIDTEVVAFQQKDGREENRNTFICSKDKKEYLIVIQVPDEVVIVPEAPKVYQMKFKVVDDENLIVPSAEITVSYLGKTQKLFTDAEGYAILEGVQPGTQVKVIAKGEKQKKKKT